MGLVISLDINESIIIGGDNKVTLLSRENEGTQDNPKQKISLLITTPEGEKTSTLYLRDVVPVGGAHIKFEGRQGALVSLKCIAPISISIDREDMFHKKDRACQALNDSTKHMLDKISRGVSDRTSLIAECRQECSVPDITTEGLFAELKKFGLIQENAGVLSLSPAGQRSLGVLQSGERFFSLQYSVEYQKRNKRPAPQDAVRFK